MYMTKARTHSRIECKESICNLSAEQNNISPNEKILYYSRSHGLLKVKGSMTTDTISTRRNFKSTVKSPDKGSCSGKQSSACPLPWHKELRNLRVQSALSSALKIVCSCITTRGTATLRSEVGEFYQTEVKNNIKKKTDFKQESNERSEEKQKQ